MENDEFDGFTEIGRWNLERFYICDKCSACEIGEWNEETGMYEGSGVRIFSVDGEDLCEYCLRGKIRNGSMV